MTPDFIKAVSGIFLQNIHVEIPVTKKVMAAVPDANHDYRPDPKSKTAIELAWHMATSDIWFFESIAKHQFEMSGDSSMPAEIKTGSDVAKWYETQLAISVPKVEAMTGEELSVPVDFFGMFNFPAAFYLQFLGNHMIHHRGQLSTYLRAMGGRVPVIYGGSADEGMGATP